MHLRESLTQSSTMILSTSKGGSRAKRISSLQVRKCETPSTSSVWPSDHWDDYSHQFFCILHCALPFNSLIQFIFKRCTLTNKAVWTIWRTLFKPRQRRQGPDPRPLLLLVGIPSAFGPELTYRLRVAQPTLMDAPRYVWYTIIPVLLYMFVYHIVMTSPVRSAVGSQSL